MRCKVETFDVNLLDEYGKSAVSMSLTSLDFQTHLTRYGELDFPKVLPDLSMELQLINIRNQSLFESCMNVAKLCIEMQESKPLLLRKKSGKLDQYMHRYCVGIVLEAWNANVGIWLPEPSCNALLAIQHVRHSLAMTQGLHQLAAELLIEALISTFPDSLQKDVTLQYQKKFHHWGTFIALGLCLVQVSSSLLTSNSSDILVGLFPLQVDALLDSLQVEWTETLAEFATTLLHYLVDKEIIKSQKTLKLNKKREVIKVCSGINVNCTGVNVFTHLDHKVSAVLRIDGIDFNKSEKNFKGFFNGTKCVKVVANKHQFQCLKSSEMKDEWLEISEASVDFIDGEILVNISERCFILWSPNLHMVFLTLSERVLLFLADIKKFLVADKQPENASVAASNTSGLHLQVILRCPVSVGAQLSKTHTVHISLNDLIYLMANGRISCQTDELVIHFDEHEMGILAKAKLAYVLQSKEVMEERESFEQLTQRENRAWRLTADSLSIVFPYEYHFAEAFSDDFLSVFKWLKLIHKPGKKSQSAERLPFDIVVKIHKWNVNVCDDPFEVKLRYNYELLEDEYQEGCKRLKALEARIEEVRKSTFMIPSGKIEELYKTLQEKNSETYVKRSKLMYQSSPVRTQLFTWNVEDLIIFAMADPSLYGTDNVIRCMQDIDFESPWPEDCLKFSTLWCRMISMSCSAWKFRLRDYPLPLLDMIDVEFWGRLIGAEQEAHKRAKRNVNIEIGHPWTDATIERSMTTLKFYHDLSSQVTTFTAAYGPCWEPAMSQFNNSLSLINKPSRDPSPPLPWWDKMRLLFHGRLIIAVDRMALLLHASLDPYNTTEEMELTWTDLNLDWSNAKFIFRGDLNVYVKTASKYDDARLLHLPSLRLIIKLNWICGGNPNNHHAVMLCAPDKLPVLLDEQKHDSYRAFRSQNLDTNIGMETKTLKKNNVLINPVIEALFYGSTLRWFENLKFILSGASRPIRKGCYFKSTLSQKPQLSRHYRTVHLALSFQRFDIRYWMSVGVKKGFHLSGERLSLSSEHSLTLVPIKDGLRHRPSAFWSIVFINTELNHAQIWLQSVMKPSSEDKSANSDLADKELLAVQTVEKFYFLNVSKVAYSHETLTSPTLIVPAAADSTTATDKPDHRLVVYDLKGAWTTNNRDIVFALYDAWHKAQQLRQNLSPDVIKGFNPDSPTPLKPRRTDQANQMLTSPTTLQVNQIQNTPSPMTRLQTGQAQAMLQQLISEADNNQVAFSEDCSSTEIREHTLHGVAACTLDDVIHKKWLIELVNSQVLLKGCETRGYVITSAAKAQVHQRVHRPVWRGHSLVMKTTWHGSLENMQYYATVSPGNKISEMENIMWLTVDNIEAKEGHVITDVPDIVGSGQSVGGVVSQTVGGTDEESEALQIQRIVSRCQCEFFYASYGETGLDPELLEEVLPEPPEDDLWNKNIEAVDTFTLMHHDLCVCTNSLQYNMIVDILNNLFLYVDRKKKEESEALARMRFKIQLYSREDQRKPIIRLQNQVRYHLSQLRFLEKSVYLLQRQLDSEPSNSNLLQEKARYEIQVCECKEHVNSLAEELTIRIHCYNEMQVSTNHKLAASGGEKKVEIIRMNEICFRKAQWKLTEADGQYTRKCNIDDSGEHLFELGYINMRNLLPNQMYSEVLTPSELQINMPVDRQRTLRILCREQPRCGGISIIEHFEINVVPLNIALTYQFFKTMMKFCFPENASEEERRNKEVSQGADIKSNTWGARRQGNALKKKESSFYVKLYKDDVEIMKQRAEQNKLYVYIKIPEVPVKVSYKGKKEKNIEDASNFRLTIPTIEYHNVTWTWLDFLMAVKTNAKSALLSQAIKHKLNISHTRTHDSAAFSEDEKARLLLGNKLLQSETKGIKKSLFKFNK